MDERNVRREFYGILRGANLPRIRLHDLRHSYATILLASGEHPKVVQELLGHSSVQLTLDTYSHLLPDLQLKERAAARMDAILAGENSGQNSGQNQETNPLASSRILAAPPESWRHSGDGARPRNSEEAGDERGGLVWAIHEE